MMTTKRLIVLLVPCALCIMPGAFAQDIHFSQFMNSPLVTNPANTGFIPGGDYRIGINYRNQWSSVMSVPYQTMSAFGDMQIMQNDNGWLGAGGLILRDVAGSGNLTSTKIYGSIAYHQTLNLASLLSLGFNIGYANKQINVTNLKFPDQFDGHFFDVHYPTTGIPPNTNISYLDMQAGMNYAYFPNENTYINAGYSVMHINRPRESFFNEEPGIDNRISMRHNVFVNGSFKLNDQWIINPNSYFSMQAKSYEWLIGANAHYNLSGDGEKELIAGLYYRSQDAVIPMIGIGLSAYTFSFTYDATISTLKYYNNTRGAFEFSLIRQGVFEKFNGNRHDVICPSFKSAY
jgi:type IX secretion system PorP/SprF family membrane protein